jgi:predicted nucleic acid-binding protein
MSFLIDTDTCSAHLKQRGIVSDRFLQYTGGLHVSAISLSELYAWVLRANAAPARLQSLREMLNDMTVLDVTAQVAEKYGELQAQFLDAGTPAPGMDLMIAATAPVHQAKD